MDSVRSVQGLSILDRIPEGLTGISAAALHDVLNGPTLIHLEGRQSPALFVSILLHGNEPVGLHAVQRLLAKYRERPLPRSLSLFIGNVAAARYGVRRLPGQVDYNRVWPGTDQAPSAESELMRGVVIEMAERGVFASVDIHNNTGLNPHYACVNRLDNRWLRLAAMFGRLVIHFTHPKGTQSAAFSELCPAVTLECGKPGQRYGSEHAFEYLDACLHLTEISDQGLDHQHQALDLYHTVAQVLVKDETTFGFDREGVDLRLPGDLDRLNFTDIPSGSVWGVMENAAAGLPLIVRDEAGRDVAGDYFAVEGERLVLKKPVMPSMLTLNERVIRQDCLCYLMERATWGRTQ